MSVLKTYVTFIILTSSIQSETHFPLKIFDVYATNKTSLRPYCQKGATACAEGTHVMCMYHRNNVKYGLGCSYPQNVSITDEYAQLLLDLVNGIRSRTSRGMLQNYYGVQLPRGYGIYSVRWDSELALYAQVWADQCIPTRSYCFASKSFPDPGQSINILQFSLEDWRWMHGNKTFQGTGLTDERIRYAIKQAIFNIYKKALNVLTPTVIEKVPKHLLVNHSSIQLLFGSVTHMGCGMSVYRNYVYTDVEDVIRNSLQLVCYFSKAMEANKPLYESHLVKRNFWTKKCGCPPKYVEDPDCLCVIFSCQGRNCAQSRLVVLPILTTQDAPAPQRRFIQMPRNMEQLIEFQGAILNGSIADQVKDVELHKNAAINEYISSPTMQTTKPNISLSNEEIKNHIRNQLGNTKNIRKEKDPQKNITSLLDIINTYHYEKNNQDPTLNEKYNTTDINKIPIKDNRNETIDSNNKFNLNVNTSTLTSDIITLVNKLEQDLRNISLGSEDSHMIIEKILNIQNRMQAYSDLKDKNLNSEPQNVRNFNFTQNYNNSFHSKRKFRNMIAIRRTKNIRQDTGLLDYKHKNKRVIEEDKGIVDKNSKVVDANYGNVDKNSSTIKANHSNLDKNSKVTEVNDGEVEKDSKTIEINQSNIDKDRIIETNFGNVDVGSRRMLLKLLDDIEEDIRDEERKYLEHVFEDRSYIESHEE